MAAIVAATLLGTGYAVAPPAGADPAVDLQGAIAAERSQSSCGALHNNPVLEQAAEAVNRSTAEYLDHTAAQVPITDPLPALKDLGYGGSKAHLLQGAHTNAALALQGALLQGYAAIPDCSYTDFGANIELNDATGYQLVTVVLAGP